MDSSSAKIIVNTESKNDSLKKVDNRQCNICFDDIVQDKLVNTPCGHTFCCDCFFHWMKENYTCPCCRTLVIHREATQQRELTSNRAEIVLQEEAIEEHTQDLTNLRRLRKIHKRRIDKLEKTNKKLMERQFRMRQMLEETRQVRKNIAIPLRKIIPNDGLENYTKKFYKNLLNGRSEIALKAAKALVTKASLYEWKKKMDTILCQLCEHREFNRSDKYRDQVLDDIISGSTNMCKRKRNKHYVRQLVNTKVSRRHNRVRRNRNEINENAPITQPPSSSEETEEDEPSNNLHRRHVRIPSVIRTPLNTADLEDLRRRVNRLTIPELHDENNSYFQELSNQLSTYGEHISNQQNQALPEWPDSSFVEPEQTPFVFGNNQGTSRRV